MAASLDDLSFSCGSQLNEVNLVFVKDLQCNNPVEALYYSADNVDICVHCCADIETNMTPKEYYPQCEDCVDKDKILRKNTKK